MCFTIESLHGVIDVCLLCLMRFYTDDLHVFRGYRKVVRGFISVVCL